AARPRRDRSLPTGDEWTVRTTKQLGDPIPLKADRSQRLMLVTRTDLILPAPAEAWGPLSLADPAGPWQLEQGLDGVLVCLHSDGSGRPLIIYGSPPAPPSPPDVAPLEDNPLWAPPNQYIVQSPDTLSAIATRLVGDEAVDELSQLNSERW